MNRTHAWLFAAALSSLTGCEPPPTDDLNAAAPPEIERVQSAITQSQIDAFMKPIGKLGARRGTWKAIFICFDAKRAGEPRPLEYHEAGSLLWGDDGGESVQGWYANNSNNTYNLEWTATRGCGGASGSYGAPAGFEGGWYWTNGRWDLMWSHAIARASQDFDFRAFDKNKDKRITPDELAVIVAVPQTAPYGTFRSKAVTVDVPGGRLTFDVVDTYVSPDSAQRRNNVGILAHELSHALAKTADMYPYNVKVKDETVFVRHPNPGVYSLMDNHRIASFMDPFHRMKLHWMTPWFWDLSELGGQTLSQLMAPVGHGGAVDLFFHPSRGTREYFMVENRSTAQRSDGGINYDAPLPVSGPVLWHVVENFDDAFNRPPPGFDRDNWRLHGRGDWGRTGVRFLGTCGDKVNTPIPLVWSDGKQTGYQLVCRGEEGTRGDHRITVEPRP